jgi:hypothetical protein
MNNDMKYPQKGDYYYHYKHDRSKDRSNYAYIIEGIAVHSETEELMVAYRPLYSGNHVEEFGADCNVRPLDMFCEDVDKPDYQGPRFRKMTEEEVKKLQELL